MAYGPNSELLYEASGTDTKSYVYLNGVPLARIDNNSQVYYYHDDHLGTPQAMTDSSGTVVWQAYYEPFGKTNITVNTITNNLRIGNSYQDTETGWWYMGHRFYDPGVGGFPTSDPIGLAGGLNTYTYAYNNPLKYIDPVGWAAYCKYILELEWRLKARGDKIISYKFQKPSDRTVDPFYDALSNMGPAFYIPIKIPVYQDTELQQQFNVKYLVCLMIAENKSTSGRKARTPWINIVRCFMAVMSKYRTVKIHAASW